jgi:hypothetical protein
MRIVSDTHNNLVHRQFRNLFDKVLLIYVLGHVDDHWQLLDQDSLQCAGIRLHEYQPKAASNSFDACDSCLQGMNGATRAAAQSATARAAGPGVYFQRV